MKRSVIWLLWGTLVLCGTLVFRHLFHEPASIPVEVVKDRLAKAARLNAGGDEEQASDLLEEILQSDPEQAEALILLGRIHWNSKRESALELWNRVPDSAATFASEARFLEGAALLERNDPVAAEAKLLQATKLQPNYVPAWELLKELYALQRRKTELRQTLQAIGRTRPLRPDELAQEILAGQALYPAKAAISTLDQFLKVNPGDRRSALAKAWILREQGRYFDAEQLLPPCKGHPDCIALKLTLSMDLGHALSLSEFPELPETLEEWTPEGLFALAMLASKSERHESAVKFCSAAIKNAGFVPSVYQQLGRSLHAMGRNRVSEQAFVAANAADEIERDAYLVLRGHPIPQLVAEKMLQISDNLQIIGQASRAVAWRDAAGDMLTPSELSGLPDGKATTPLKELQATIAESAGLSKVSGRILQELAVADSPIRSGGRETEELLPFRFVDRATEADLDFQYDNGAKGQKLIIESIGGGVGVIDYDNDGWPDLFFPQGGSLPVINSASNSNRNDRLYRNQADGTFRDVTVTAGIHDDAYGLGCVVGDYDNDGDPDILVANAGPNLLWTNNNDGTFSNSWLPESESELSASMALADFDGDGNSDLFVVNYVRDWSRLCQKPDGEFSTCLPVGLPAAPDQILVNDGHGSFQTENWLAEKSKVPHRGLGIVTQDLNGDGLCDAYVANDGTANQLFLNQRSSDGSVQLTDMALLLGCALSGEGRTEAGMGVAVADFDEDAIPDVFVTNFYQEANRLYRQLPSGLFVDETSSWQLVAPSLPVLGFGVQSSDWNLDGIPDLFVTNGDIDDYSQSGRPWKMPAQVFAGVRGHGFSDVSGNAGDFFRQESLGRGVATGDFNRDGLMDIVVVHQDRPVGLLMNESTPQSYVSVRVRGVTFNRDAIAARLTLNSSKGRRSQWIQGGHGFMASNDRMVVFAVPDDLASQELTIMWAHGKVSVHTLPNPKRSSELIVREVDDDVWEVNER